MHVKLLIGLILLLVSAQASASLNSEIAKCAATPSDAARLVCYDALAQGLGIDKPKVQVDKSAGKWQIMTQKSPIDDNTNVYLSVDADQTIQSGFNSVRPTLVVRCAQDKTDVYITWGLYLGLGSTEMLTRLDREKATTATWYISTNDKAVFVGGSAIAFAKRLMGHNKLLVQITPYGENPVMATFPIRGLSTGIEPVRRACNW